MAMGLVEIIGFVSGTDYILSPFSQKNCVYYRYYVEERVHDNRSSSSDDFDNDRWKNIASGERIMSFYVADETGEVLIVPYGAKIEAKAKNAYYQDRGKGWGRKTIVTAFRDFDKTNINVLDFNRSELRPIDPNQLIFKMVRVGDRRYYEFFIEPDEKLYIIGTAAHNPEYDPEVFIKKGKNEPLFLISYKSENKLSGTIKLKSIGLLLFGSILLILGIVILF
jgi:hypothetical protein